MIKGIEEDERKAQVWKRHISHLSITETAAYLAELEVLGYDTRVTELEKALEEEQRMAMEAAVQHTRDFEAEAKDHYTALSALAAKISAYEARAEQAEAELAVLRRDSQEAERELVAARAALQAEEPRAAPLEAAAQVEAAKCEEQVRAEQVAREVKQVREQVEALEAERAALLERTVAKDVEVERVARELKQVRDDPPLPPPPASRVASHLTTDKQTAQVEAEVEAATNGGLMPVAPAPPNPGAVVWFTGVEGQEWPCKVVDTKGGVVRLDKFPLVPNAKPGSVKSKCVYANASQWVPWEDRGPQGAGAMGGSTLADAVAAADRHVRGIAEGPRNRKKLAALMCQPVVDIEFPHTNVVDIDDDLRA